MEAVLEQPQTKSLATPIRSELDFFLVSAFSLFLEILLIRWLGTEVRIFAYVSNLVLVVCFVGLGIGYATDKFRLDLRHTAWAVFILILLAHPWLEPLGFRSISEAVATGDYNTWSAPVEETTRRAMGFARLAVLLMLVGAAFIGIGRTLGHYFETMKTPRSRIRAYSVNVAASAVGIWAFSALSVLRQPPVVWMVLGTAALLWTLRSHKGALISTAVASLLTIGLITTSAPADGDAYWSPYQKLVLRSGDIAGVPMWSLEVNNTLYQYVLDLSDDALDSADIDIPRAERPYMYYNFPYRLHRAPKSVLVVGAGTGNDVAAALRNGAESVDAVEIDPVIVELGRTFHPEKPYDDPRVTVVVDDARAHFKQTKNKYDLIVFGLLDSHKLTSNHSNINLDSYVYTVESLTEAQGLLKEGGAIVLAFQTFFPYIAWRLHDVLEEAIGRAPIPLFIKAKKTLLEGTGGVVFYTGTAKELQSLRSDDPGLDIRIAEYQRAMPAVLLRDSYEGHVELSTDDWPYLYVETPAVPSLLITVILMVLIIALLTLPLAGLSLRKLDGQFFFLGAAFMFLETQAITRAQLFVGATWAVSGLVVTFVLLLILVGNVLVIKLQPKRLEPWYVALLAMAMANWAVETGSLRSLGDMAIVVAAILATAPMLFAAVIFGTAFTRAEGARHALSSNLIGALCGGLLECLSYMTGLRALALLAVALYAVALLLGRRAGALDQTAAPAIE
jgi:SAM-dependent methyltransferase